MSFCAFSWKKSWCRLISWCTSMEGIFHEARHKFCKCRKVSSFDSRKIFAKNAWNLWLHDKRMGGHFKDASSIRFVIRKSTRYLDVDVMLIDLMLVLIAKMFACQFQILILSKGNNKTSITSFNCCQYDYETWWIYVEFRLSNIINHLSKALN